MIEKNYLWVEKYRPHTVDECILPDRLKTTFAKFVSSNEIPNTILLGKAGTGKTSIAKAMAEELQLDMLEINCSMDGNIDTLRTTIQQFVSTTSLVNNGQKKLVLLDEADYLNANSTQPAMRNFIESFSDNAIFILTANYGHKIIEPLHSRCPPILFNFSKSELQNMAGQFLKRVIYILDIENVEYDKKVVAEVIMKHLPDWRRVLGELQRYSASGKIDTGILGNSSDLMIPELIEMMKTKNFTGVRKWCGENSDIDSSVLYRKFYDNAKEYFAPQCIPTVVLLIAKYSDYATRAVDLEINNAAFCAEIMSEVVWQ